jgi:hypothetical protein
LNGLQSEDPVTSSKAIGSVGGGVVLVVAIATIAAIAAYGERKDCLASRFGFLVF